MPRIRYIKPETSLDEELAACSLAARLFFRDLWCHCDRAGRVEDRPMKLKAQIFPYEPMDVDRLLNELAPRFLVRYEVDGRRYIQVIHFEKHQKPHHTEKKSAIPEPPKEVLKRCKDGYEHVHTPLKTGRNGDGNGDGNGEREGERGLSPESLNSNVNPTLEQVRSYLQEIDSPTSPERFFAYQEKSGWPQDDWKAVAREWKMTERISPRGLEPIVPKDKKFCNIHGCFKPKDGTNKSCNDHQMAPPNDHEPLPSAKSLMQKRPV